MKSPYKINIDRPKVSSEEIFTHRDFRVVQSEYDKARNSSFFKKKKNTWLYLGLLLLFFVAAGWLTFSLVNFKMLGEIESKSSSLPVTVPTPSESTVSTDSLITESVFKITPPLENVDVSFATYSVNTLEGRKIIHDGWSYIQVPSEAFLNAEGQIVEGTVEVQYREFQDAADVFLAGIPVTYDSLGQQYFWQSAGMVELKAFYQGEEVFPNPERPITIELASTEGGKDYNLYHFDTKGWSYKGKDEVKKVRKTISEATGGTIPVKRAQAIKRVETRIDNIKIQLKQINLQMDSLKVTVPKAPKQAEKGKHLFNIDVYNGDFPELEVYKNVLFQIGDENEDFKPNLYNVNWDEAYITERVKDLNYNLQLRHRRKKYSFVVYPVLAGRDYEEAMKEYGGKYKTYQNEYAKSMSNEKALHESLEQERERLLKLQKTAYIQNSVQEQLYRTFKVEKFGLWNVNQPSKVAKQTISATFMDGEGSPIKIEQVHLAELDNNALYIFQPSTYEYFSYNPEARNVIWSVDNEGSMWVYWPTYFEYIPQDQPSFEFIMEKVDQRFENAEEVKAFLGF